MEGLREIEKETGVTFYFKRSAIHVKGKRHQHDRVKGIIRNQIVCIT